MADQIAAASQAISQIPPLPDGQFAELQARLDEIAEKQSKFESDLDELRKKIESITEGPEKLQKQLEDHIAEFKLE